MQTWSRVRVAVVALTLALGAGAVAAPPVDAQDYAQTVGAAALDQINYDVSELGWTIAFLQGRSGYLGLAIGEERRIEIYVRSSHGVDDVAHTLAHELGHAVDLTYGTPYRRREYRRIRGLSTEQKWFGCDACSDYSTPAGDFAEVFEYWLLGGGDYRSTVAGGPDTAQLQNLSHLFIAPFSPSVRVFWQQRWQMDA